MTRREAKIALITGFVKAGLTPEEAVAASKASESYVFGEKIESDNDAVAKVWENPPEPIKTTKPVREAAKFNKRTSPRKHPLPKGAKSDNRCRPWSDADKQQAANLINMGASHTAVAETMGRTRKSVYSMHQKGWLPNCPFVAKEMQSIGSRVGHLSRGHRIKNDGSGDRV